MGRSQRSKRGSGAAASEVSKQETGTTEVSVDELIERAHALLGQENLPLAIQHLEAALAAVESQKTQSSAVSSSSSSGSRPMAQKIHEIKELLGIALVENNQIEQGRTVLLELVASTNPESNSDVVGTRGPAPYLYLAQTAVTGHEALMYYESALHVLQSKLDDTAKKESAMDADGDAEETEQDIKRDMVAALIAMIEIWMSDLCFEPAAPASCDSLIDRALAISPEDPEVNLTLASIRMSESKFDEAANVIINVARSILLEVERLKKEVPEIDEEKLEELMQDENAPHASLPNSLPPIPLRNTLVRLLLEHNCYNLALRVIDSIRAEDELDVEGCYLEAWTWMLKAIAAEEGTIQPNQAETLLEKELGTSEDDESNSTSVQDCYENALASAMETISLHESQEYPDEGLLVHAKEIVDTLQKKGITVQVEEEGAEDADGQAMDTS